MKTLIRKYRLHLQAMFLLLAMLVCAVVLTSCEQDKLDIQQNCAVHVHVMPLPTEVANAQTVERRITVDRPGNFIDAEYFVRYFQFDGHGTVRYYPVPPYMPKGLYLLPHTQFRLY